MVYIGYRWYGRLDGLYKTVCFRQPEDMRRSVRSQIFRGTAVDYQYKISILHGSFPAFLVFSIITWPFGIEKYEYNDIIISIY